MKKKVVPVLAALILIVVVLLIAAATKLAERYKPSTERMSAADYYGITSDSEMALILQDETAGYKAVRYEDTVYVDFEAVQSFLNGRFFWDSESGICIYTTPEDVIKIKPGDKSYTLSGKTEQTEYEILRVDGESVYLALDFVQKFTNMDYSIFEDPGRIVITYKWGEITRAEIKKDTSLRYQGGIKSPILTDVKKSDKVTVIEVMDDWTQVATADGYIGYVQNKELSDGQKEKINREFEEPVYTSLVRDHKINLVWHQVTNQDSNDGLLTDIAGVKGINVISPTWFSIADNSGALSSLADARYVKRAHKKGLEVWALIDNFSENVDFTAVVNSTSAREKMADQLIASAGENGFDGINIDFETIPEEAAQGYLQFIRELSVQCRKNGIVLSVDDPVPQPYTAHYNRKEQGIVADYVIVMGYDEHYAGSEEAGSVASMPFVKAGIEDTLKEVPKEKIINAVPFYTRLWITSTNENGSVELTSQAIGMDLADETLTKNNVSSAWDQNAMQDYAEYQDEEGNSYKIWLENEKSITEKAKLVQEYDLGGIAAWKLGFERDNIWDVIQKYVS